MVSKIMLRFSACPASQRNVRLQFNRKVSWIECVYTGSNPADALTRRGGESAARYARLSSEALGFMGIGKKPYRSWFQFSQALLESRWLHFWCPSSADHA